MVQLATFTELGMEAATHQITYASPTGNISEISNSATCSPEQVIRANLNVIGFIALRLTKVNVA